MAYDGTLERLRAENAALKEQLSSAQKDAERYRWLKKQHEKCWPNENFDSNIDAAIEKERS